MNPNALNGITAMVPNHNPGGGPFDTITITHPDGDIQQITVPEFVHGCRHMPAGEGCWFGPHRLHLTLRSNGYRAVGDPVEMPGLGLHGAVVYPVEQVTETS